MKGLLIGATKVGNREFTIADSQRVVPVEKVGLDKSFYGGRVQSLVETRHPNIYLCLERRSSDKIIDVYVSDKSELANENIFDVKSLKQLADRLNVKYEKSYSRQQMLFLFGIKVDSPHTPSAGGAVPGIPVIS